MTTVVFVKGGLVLGISVVVFIVVPINDTESSKDTKDKEKVETTAKPKEETPEEKAEAERLAKLESLKLSGSGDSVTKKVKLDAGFVIIDATHQGSRNFAVKLLDSNANTLKLVVNEIGNYSGKKYMLYQLVNIYMR